MQEMLDDTVLCDNMIDEFLSKTGLIIPLQKYAINGGILTINNR